MKIMYAKALCLMMCLSFYIGQAQNNTTRNQLDQKIPFDPSVTQGKLKNGLTYYIKKNTRPENKAELRLVLRAGSLLEEEDQQGLAHFLEHMAFNGTEHFEKNELIDYLQSIGIEFGADLNAHTGFDETVYKLSVPTDDQDIYNTSMQVLRDWAGDITLSNEEIDNERGIIAEELRARSGAFMRMYYESLPVLTNNARHASRLPIGKLDVINNSDYEAIKRFYKDWYRPDLMALVVVGDVDVKQTENKIKTMFKDLTMLKNPKKHIEFDIKPNTGIEAAIITDKETSGTNVAIYYKQENEEEKTLDDYRTSLLTKLYSGMLRQRLDEVTQIKDSPFLKASAGIGRFLGNMDSYFLRGTLRKNDVSAGIQALIKESERARRYGFTQGELDRYKKEMLTTAEFFMNESDKIPTRIHVEALIDHYTFEDPVVSQEFMHEFYKDILPTIALEEVNALADKWITPIYPTIVLNAPEDMKDELPSKDQLKEFLRQAKKIKVEPYQDDLEGLTLMKEKPEPGKIVEESYNEKVKVTTLKLSNGVTVLLRPTTFQNDMIKMSGFRPGGSSVAPDSIYISARESGSIVANSGINGISPIQLDKLNMGKNVSVKPYVHFYDDRLSASSNNKDLEHMFKMTYLYFTKPNKDQNTFASHKDGLISIFKDADKDPGRYYDKVIAKTMVQDHQRGVPLTVDQVDELDLDVVYDFYVSRFDNANGFTFIITGNYELAQMKNLVKQYLGSLPANLDEESDWRDFGLRRVEGRVSKTIHRGIEPKSEVDMRYTGKLDYTPEKAQELNLLAKVLRIRLTEELREKMSGVYGVRTGGFTTDRPYDWYRMEVRFTCAPDNVEKLKQKVFEEIEAIKKNGVSEENVNKIKQAELSNIKEFLKNDSYWISQLKEAYEYNKPYDHFLNYEEEIEKIDSDYFKDAANRYFDNENYAEFILMPEE